MKFLSPLPRGYARRSSITTVCENLIYSKPWQKENWAWDKTKVIHQARTGSGKRRLPDISDLI